MVIVEHFRNAEPIKNKKVFSCRSSSSLSSVIGNVSYIVKQFISGLFPPDYFSKVYIDTQLTSVYYEKEFRDGDGVFKSTPPYLVIRPKFQISDDTYFGRLPDWMTTNYFIFKNLEDNYSPVFFDRQNEIYIYSVPDRIKINFEIDIVSNTRMEQLNIAHYLKNSVMHRSYFYLNDCKLETEVPKYFIKVLAENYNIDMQSKGEKEDFLSYIADGSQNFITEKIKASSGNPSYFYIYKTNLLSMFEDFPSIDDGKQKNLVDEGFRISDNFSTEFWVPSNYFLEIGNRRVMDNIGEVKEWDIHELGFDRVVLNYTLNFVPDMDLCINGRKFQFVRKIGYITDDNEDFDILPIEKIFSDDMKQVIKYNNKYGISNEEAFYIKVFYEDKEVNPKNININWEKLELINFHCRTETTYHILLYINKERVNRTIYRLNQLENSVYHDDKPIQVKE